jgi:hypothetical protein
VTEEGDVMKTRLLLVFLAGILVFGCTPMQTHVDDGRAQTAPATSCIDPPATPTPDHKCVAGAKCHVKITLDVKTKNVVGVHNDGDTGPKPDTPCYTKLPRGVEITGFATVLFTKSSPGCVYYYYGGAWWYICDE